MIDIQIITLTPSRWEESRAIRLEALQSDPLAFGSSYEESLEMTDTEWLERVTSAYEKKNQIALYAEADEKLVGMMGAFWSNRMKLGHIASIYGVYVARDYRGQGVGTLLMKSLLDEISALPHITKINLTLNTTQLPAQKLYEKFGFQPIGVAHRELKYEGQYYDELFMEKLL